MKNRIVNFSVALLTVFSFASVGTVSATAAPSRTGASVVVEQVPTGLYVDRIKTDNVDGAIRVPQATTGLKSFVVKRVLKSLAYMVRHNTDEFISLAEKQGLDKTSARAVRNNTSKIAGVLEDVAEIPDIAAHSAKDAIYNTLRPSLGGGTANVIAQAVYGLIWVLA